MLYAELDDHSRAAAAAAGIGFLNISAMLGMRPDAHWGSVKIDAPGNTDILHFCAGGPQEYALEEVLRAAAAEAARMRTTRPSPIGTFQD